MSNEIIYVTNEGVSEHLNFIESFELVEEVLGDNSISFVSYRAPENHAYELLEEEAMINVGEMEYRIKEVVEYRNRKEIFAQNVFFDLITIRRNVPFGGNYTFQQFLDFIFEDTGWTYSGDVEGQMVIDRFGRDNLIKLVNRLCESFECEYDILPNREVVFTKEIGGDEDFQYRYGHNIVAMSKTVDTTNLRTVIRGYGADEMEVIYYSPNVEIFGELEADPVQDERFSIKENFIEYVKTHLIDYPEVTIELDAIELLERDLGENVWLIYEPLGIEFHTRVLSKTSIIRDDRLVTGSVVIGNTLPRTMSDIMDDVIEEAEEQNVINSSKFEQTDSKIEMEVKRVETYVDEEIGEVRKDATSNFTILAGRIEAKADYSEVSDLGTRVNSVEFNMNAIEGEISTKVSQSDYTGEVMVSKINQTASSVKIQAKNITLAGAVTVLSELSTDLGTITAGNINISQDVRIGNNLYLGALNSSSEKQVIFNSSARITGGGGPFGADLVFSGSRMVFIGGEVDFTGATGLRGVAAAHSDGIGVSYDNNKLYVKVHGTTVGSVVLS